MSCWARAWPRPGRPFGTWAHALLLHRLRQPLGALAHGLQRAALAVDRAVGIALAELTFGLAHGFAGIAELAHLVALALLTLLALLALAGRARAGAVAPGAC